MNVHTEKFLKDIFAMNENDIKIISADGTHEANSQLLKARSIVFKSMLNNTMKEGITKEIKMTTYSGPAISSFISYIQTCTLPIAPSNQSSIAILLQLCELSDQYVLPDLLLHTKNLLLSYANSLSSAMDTWTTLISEQRGGIVKEEIMKKCQQTIIEVMWGKKVLDRKISLESLPVEVKVSMLDFLMKHTKIAD